MSTRRKVYPAMVGKPVEIAATVRLSPRKGHMVAAVGVTRYFGWCDDCPREFNNPGAALSHGRAARHIVHLCSESEPVAYIPSERIVRGEGE